MGVVVVVVRHVLWWSTRDRRTTLLSCLSSLFHFSNKEATLEEEKEKLQMRERRGKRIAVIVFVEKDYGRVLNLSGGKP